MFTHSVCSYPQRGNYGKSGYRGNCTGYIIRDFVESYLAPEGLFADPSIGSGTSSDVAEEMGIRFKGTDLHQGYNLLTQDFAAFLGEQANLIWWHPPYWNMIRYSGNQWGDAANPWDLSQMDLEQFQEAMLLAMMNIHDATEQGGHYGILMGNMRKDGRYYNLSSMVERMAAGRLVDEIIKIQHNCVSDSRQYGGKLVRIAHEKLLVFKKEIQTALYFLAKAMNRVEAVTAVTWKAAVRRVWQAADGRNMGLTEIYGEMEPYAAARAENRNWQAKVRQVLQDERFFLRVGKGIYALKTE